MDLYNELQAKIQQLEMSIKQLRTNGTAYAEAVYKANQEAINSIKLQMRIIENQLSREWGIAK